MEVSTIIIMSIIMAILLYVAIYDIKYQDVDILAPISIWALALINMLILGFGTIEVLIAFTSGLFLFVLGLMLFIAGSTGFGDALLFFSIGFLLGTTQKSMYFLAFTMISFIPFFIIYILKYWKKEGYDIKLNGFLRQINIRELKEGMVLAQSRIWKGINKDQIDNLKNEHGLDYKIWIKEGIPFAPAMFCGMVFLLVSGVI